MSRKVGPRSADINEGGKSDAIRFAMRYCLPPARRRWRVAIAARIAQDKTFELKLSHWVPPSHPLQKALEDWGASVEKASGGTIKFKVFPAQQLGKAFDHYDMARDGIADLTYINPGYQPGRFPIIGAGELPFLIANGKGGSQALDAWYRKYADKEMKDVKFCLAFVHDPGTFHSKTKKIMVPGDIKGMKIRPAHATMAHLRHAARRHQRAVERAGSARHSREGRRRRGDLPVGLGAAVRHRQGDQVSHGRAALRDHLRLGVQQGQVQPDVGGAEEGDRRPLHQRMGAEGRGAVGRLRARRRRQAEGRSRARGLHDHAASSSPNGRRRPSRCRRRGPTT